MLRSPELYVPVNLSVVEGIGLKGVGDVWEGTQAPHLAAPELETDRRLTVGVCVRLAPAILKDEPEFEGVARLIGVEGAAVKEVGHGEDIHEASLRLPILSLVLDVPNVGSRKRLASGQVLLRLGRRLLDGVPLRVLQVDVVLVLRVLGPHVLIGPTPAVLGAREVLQGRLGRTIIHNEGVASAHKLPELLILQVLDSDHLCRIFRRDLIPFQPLVVLQRASIILREGHRVMQQSGAG
mmetsp:Transcript_61823/g.139557  ORF Transcript_61823/g.139557 Transcript_61823/m.139557 type:complete len:238 (+) Transcript_61823:591-1304(+)